MSQDWYENYKCLSCEEVEGKDFHVCVTDLDSDVLIMAPHGGYIERYTSKIASAIAKRDYSLYLFEGLRSDRKHCELHITSHKFDEPKAVEIASRSSKLIALHGRKDKEDQNTVWLGGLDLDAIETIKESLCSANFKVMRANTKLAGKHSNNICNRTSVGKGVQLEIPLSLRKKLAKENKLLTAFAEAIRGAIRIP